MTIDERTTNSPLNKLQFTDNLYNLMWDIKREHMLKVANAFGVTIEHLKDTLHESLRESNMNIGACNLAVGFLITMVEQGEYGRYSLEKEIRNQILNSAIYYANGLGLNPN